MLLENYSENFPKVEARVLVTKIISWCELKQKAQICVLLFHYWLIRHYGDRRIDHSQNFASFVRGEKGLYKHEADDRVEDTDEQDYQPSKCNSWNLKSEALSSVWDRTLYKNPLLEPLLTRDIA